MYDTRYSPAYQIPFHPLYETTRLQIERSIFSLQEKFRRRKEIDLQLAARPILPPIPLQHYYQNIHLAQQDRLISNMQQEINYQRQISTQAEHLRRIEMLRVERDLLQRDKQYKRQAEFTPPINYLHYDNNAEDDQLIKKYQDGSKAKEYYTDLHLQSKRKNQQDQVYEQERQRIQQESSRKVSQNLEKRFSQLPTKPVQQTNNKQHGYSQRKDSNPNKKEVYETPYDIIRQNQNTLKKQEPKRSPLAQELQKQFDKIEQEKHRQHSPNKFAQTMNIKDNTPLRLLDQSNKNRGVSPSKGLNKYQSMGKFAPYRSKSALSPMKSYNESYLQSRRIKNEQPKLSMKEIEFNALKKIQNRLKVSKVMYEDSQFRNIKYQQNHLYNTYEIECRQRKQIKDKVNGHPQVLKKHALVC